MEDADMQVAFEQLKNLLWQDFKVRKRTVKLEKTLHQIGIVGDDVSELSLCIAEDFGVSIALTSNSIIRSIAETIQTKFDSNV